MPMLKATGAAFNLPELFINFPTRKLKVTGKQCLELVKDNHKDTLVFKIFRDHFKEVINDVIDNNVTFRLPTGKVYCDIHMRTIKGDDFAKLRKKGKFKNVDFLKSDFTGNELCLLIKPNNRVPKLKTIYLNRALLDKIDDNTNEGKKYC